MEAEISVQIPAKDPPREAFQTTLDCLRRQETDGRPWELVIVDDGSEVPVSERFDLTFPGNVSVRLEETGRPSGRATARNLAWQSSTAPISLMMDADLASEPDLLRRHLRDHREEGWDVVMGARVNAWRENASPWERWCDGRAMDHLPPGPFPWRYFITGNISVPRRMMEETGGFDTNIVRYGGEDTELGLRLKKLGATLFWDPEIRVRHLDHVPLRRHLGRLVDYGKTGLRYILEKHPEARTLLGSHWVLGPARGAIVLWRPLVRLTLLRPVYRSVLLWMERVGRPGFLFTYLSVGAHLMGLLDRDFR